MKRIAIYYFSGTGNSFAVARDLSEKLDAHLISVSSLINQESIAAEADLVGFVFPIYDFKPPALIGQFIRKLKSIELKYIFAVCTCGLTTSHSLKFLEKEIKNSGGRLSAGFAVHMPHNGVGSGAASESKHEQMFENWKMKCEEICAYVRAENEGRIESSSVFFTYFEPWVIRMLPSAFKLLAIMLLRGVNALAFAPDARCNGCGICEKICPLQNIEITRGKPVWGDNCVSCFACLHWCPMESISLGGYDMNIRIYHHPDVKITDLMKRK